ncbi:MAG: dihydroorotate dehydrogenase, partial [Candidatus Omnitrophota bacterium]|nr:dihydroorotate dehydrogenase [Candidatus Omnitrophota bacterium]
QSKDATYNLVKKVRELTDKTLITKLSPNVTDIVEIAQAACKGGTDAVSLVNTFFGMAIDIETKKPKLGNVIGGLSGPCIKPIALKMVWDVARSIKKPVIGMGGIMNAGDAIEFLIAGAKAIQVGTANFVDPSVCEKIIKGIETYSRKNKL